jgi:hypothetical protein
LKNSVDEEFAKVLVPGVLREFDAHHLRVQAECLETRIKQSVGQPGTLFRMGGPYEFQASVRRRARARRHCSAKRRPRRVHEWSRAPDQA